MSAPTSRGDEPTPATDRLLPLARVGAAGEAEEVGDADVEAGLFQEGAQLAAVVGLVVEETPTSSQIASCCGGRCQGEAAQDAGAGGGEGGSANASRHRCHASSRLLARVKVTVPESSSMQPVGVARCANCGSVLYYRPQRQRESLATPEQKRVILDDLVAQGDWESFRDRLAGRLAAYGSREFWSLSYHCPGCGALGGCCSPEYTQEEAEAIATAQNAAASAREAAPEAAHWREEVRRRAERHAHHFAALLLARFPQWKPFLRFVTCEGAGDLPEDLEWQCSLVVHIPSENPAVREPLEVRVFDREVRPAWGNFWHTHVEPRVGDEDLEHLPRAVALLARIVREEVIFGIRLRGEEVVGGFYYPADREPPPAYVDLGPDQPGWADRIVLRSWRGRHDRTITRTDGS